MKKVVVEDNRVWINPLDVKILREKNPRTAKNSGFTEEEMAALRTGIQRDGLDHPLLVWINADVPRLIAGERRLRSILHLIAEDAEAKDAGLPRIMCKNQISGKQEPAAELYKRVECKSIECADEREARRRSIQENTLHAQLSEFELLEQVAAMEAEKFTRAEQADTLGVSEAHISQSHSLLKSHSRIVEYMEKGLLCRTAALTFLSIPEDKVVEVLDRAIALTFREADQKEQQAIQEQGAALDQMEAASDQLTLAQFTGDHPGAKKARRTIQRSVKAADKAGVRAQSAATKKRSQKMTVEVITAAAREVEGASDEIKRPEATKRVRQIVRDMDELLLKDGKLIRPDTKMEYDRRHVQILRDGLSWQIGEKKAAHPFDLLTPIK